MSKFSLKLSKIFSKIKWSFLNNWEKFSSVHQLCFQASCLWTKSLFLNNIHRRYCRDHFWIFCTIFSHVECWLWIQRKHSWSLDKFQKVEGFCTLRNNYCSLFLLGDNMRSRRHGYMNATPQLLTQSLWNRGRLN